ncbi:hypothetical protein GCM10009795_096470 [Nocardioides hankookensis]|uniref:Sortase domain-bontaining protein n=1 Tax=Nocardioides hankookensis TaxID=443157 RepID=A0ABW1LMY2_9ACTN
MTRHSSARQVAICLLVLGLVATGYAIWVLVGTNVVAHHRAGLLVERTRDSWARGEASSVEAIVRIPRFGDDWAYPVVNGTDDAALARGVGRDTGSAKPGEVGNLVLAAHRITHGQPFNNFPDLRAGDRVYVDTKSATYVYELRNGGRDIEVDADVSWPLQPVPSPASGGEPAREAMITLITCADLFPSGNRNVVIGDLVATTPGSVGGVGRSSGARSASPYEPRPMPAGQEPGTGASL